MFNFLFGLCVGSFILEPIVINFVYFTNIDLFTDIILTKKNRKKLLEWGEIMNFMKKIEKMPIFKKRAVLLRVANKQGDFILVDRIRMMTDDEVNEVFMKILAEYTKEGSVKNV